MTKKDPEIDRQRQRLTATRKWCMHASRLEATENIQDAVLQTGRQQPTDEHGRVEEAETGCGMPSQGKR